MHLLQTRQSIVLESWYHPLPFPEYMKLFLQLEPGKKLILDLEIKETASVLDLKEAINQLNSTKNPEHLHCIFQNKLDKAQKYPQILEDDKTLADYKITEGHVIKYLYKEASTGTTEK